MAPSTWLISGSARGIGRGIVSALLLRPQTTVFAGVRDPEAPTATSLKDLPTAADSSLILLKLDATSEPDHAAALTTLHSHGTTHLDVVIANAGVFGSHTPTTSVPLSEFRASFDANTLGPILLFQTLEPLLRAAANPRFVVTTSLIGSLEAAPGMPVPISAYGVSKAAVNWFLRRAHGEFPGITFVPIHPGLVASDMGKPFAELTGMEAITVETSVKGYLQQVDNATRETAGGKFVDYAGVALPL